MQSSSTTATTTTNVTTAGASAMTRQVPALWTRLQQLQPTIALTRSPAATPPHVTGMSYSFVVVPPPVPAATPAFQSHVTTLLQHVPHPTFVTCTSYSPYFTSAAAEKAATAPATQARSATQEALDYLDATLPADTALVLTVTATRATSPGTGASRHKPPAVTTATTTLTGATRAGTAAVLADFEHRLAASARSRGLMVLRGDDGGYTRACGLASTNTTTTTTAASVVTPETPPCPYADFTDGLDLLRFVRDTVTVQGAKTPAAACLCVGGYPQGHVLDRHWGTSTPIAAPASSLDLAAPPPPPRTESLRFLADLEDVYERTEALLRQARGGGRGDGDAAAKPPPADTCLATADALWARLDAVRRLWETPSVYTGAARRACTAATTTAKARDGGAHVVVTQMITSAAEFTAYVDDIDNAARATAPSAVADGQPVSLVVVPGLMAPLRGEQFLRSTLQLKVIPSALFRHAIEVYAAALRSATDTLRATAAASDTAASAMASAVHAYQQAKEGAEVAFQDTMIDITVGILRDLRAAGYTHVNFSTFQYGCGDAVGRVVSALAGTAKTAVAAA